MFRVQPLHKDLKVKHAAEAAAEAGAQGITVLTANHHACIIEREPEGVRGVKGPGSGCSGLDTQC